MTLACARRTSAVRRAVFVCALLVTGACDPFGVCRGWLHQFELMGGLVLRF
jgi:hypothetical protein